VKALDDLRTFGTRLWHVSISTYHQTLPLALAFATSLVVVVEVLGTWDYEGSFRFNSNWGAGYLMDSMFTSEPESGVKHLWGVPVFDGAQGLGHRLPNYATTPHGSSLIVLGNWIPAHLLSMGLVWLSLVISWSAFDLVGRSWNGRNGFWTRIWYSSFLSAIALIYLVYNDWHLPLVGLLGAISLVVTLFNSGLWPRDETVGVRTLNSVSLCFLSFGLLAAAHPRLWMLLPPALLISWRALTTALRAATSSSLLKVCAVCAVAMLAILLIEYQSLSLVRSDVRAPIPNLFDFFSKSDDSSGISQFGKLVVANFFLPLILIGDRFGISVASFWERSDFVNFSALISVGLLIVIAKRAERVEEIRTRIAWRALLACGSVIVWMMLTSKMQNLPELLRWLFVADGWDLQFVCASLVLAARLVVGRVQMSEKLHTSFAVRFAKSAGALGIVMACLFPIALVREAPTRHWSSPSRDLESRSFARFKASNPMKEISILGRLGDVNPRDSFDYGSCNARNRWMNALDVSHPVIVARTGVPTIESSPAYRNNDVGVTFAGSVEHCDALIYKNCDPKVLNFLSLGLALEPIEDPACSEYRALPTVSAYLASGDPSPRNGKGISYRNFYVSSEMMDTRVPEGCSLVDGCLETAIPTTSSRAVPPWNLCKADCWFTYSVFPSELGNTDWLLLPARYDSSARVTTSVDDVPLTTSSYRGLLAVRLGGPIPVENQILTIRIEADFRMRMLALLPYLSLITQLLAVIVLLRHRQLSRVGSAEPR